MKQWLSWIILLFPFLLIGQIINKEIKGVVLDEHNQAVSETEVYLLELDLKATTDSQGKFLFSKVPEGNYTLYAIKKETLQDGILPLTNSDIKDNLTISIAAKEKILDNITIQARKKSEILQHAAIKANIVNVQTDVLKSSSIDEIINRTPGVKIRNTGGLGASSNIIVGGFTGNAVRFLLDDIPIDYLGSSYGLNKIPTNMVERAEIYKGVLPSKIGIDALGSAINLVSVQKKKTGAVISYETGSYQTHIGTINGNIKLTDNWFVGTNSFYNYAKNNFEVNNLPYVEETTGNTVYIQDKLFHNAFEQGNMQFYAEGNNLSWAEQILFNIHSYELTKDIQNDAYSRARAFGKAYRKEKGNFIPSLTYKNTFFNHRLHWVQFFVYSKIDFELFDQLKNVYYDWKGHPHETVSSSEMGNLVMKNGYLKNTLSQFTTRTNLSYLLTDNLLIENNTVYSSYNYKSTLDELNPNGSDYQKLITTFALDASFYDKKISSNTQLKYLYGNLSAKYNSSENPNQLIVQNKNVDKAGVSFAQAFKYQFSPEHYMRFSYENTYRLPDKEELFGDNNFIVTNYDLEPEKSNNFNLGYTYKGQKLYVEVNTYYRNTKNLIRLKDINQYQAVFLNLDNVKGIGVEIDVNYKPFPNFDVSANLTWNDFRLQSSKDNLLNNQHYKNARIANMPFYYTNLSTSYNFKDVLATTGDLSLYWNYSYVHQYYLDFIEKQFEPDGFLGLWGNSKVNTNRIIPVQHLNNIGIVYQIQTGKHQVAISGEIKNIFNEEIFNEFKMQSPGRNYRIKLTYAF